MKLTRRSVLSTAAVAAAAGTLPSLPARAAGESLTIGVCSDFSGPYSNIGGETSVVCVKQALQDFGAATRATTSMSSPPITRTSPISAPASRGNGSTAAST